MKLLVIEDDAEAGAFVMSNLRRHGHMVDLAANGNDGLFHALDGAYDVMIVDRMLPGIDGVKIVTAIRAAGNQTPAIFLTAISSVGDRVRGLEAGADDYLVKPFAFSELLARLNALARRPPLAVQVETVLHVQDLEMDLISRRVRRAGRDIELQPREFQLLECFMRNGGRILTKTMLLERVWSFHFDPQTNIVETHVSRLRGKVDRGFGSEMIETVRGAGYRLRDQP